MLCRSGFRAGLWKGVIFRGKKKMNGERHLLKMSLSSCSAQGCEAIFISSVDLGFCVQQQSRTVCGFWTESRCNSPRGAMMSQVLCKLWRDSNSSRSSPLHSWSDSYVLLDVACHELSEGKSSLFLKACYLQSHQDTILKNIFRRIFDGYKGIPYINKVLC